jgi:hypothetical protein
MNLFNFKQTTSYFNKKRPIVYLLLAFSLVCMGVSIQSGTVFIHSFLSSYIPDVAWFWCYTVAVFIDICLFYLCAQFFSDMFGGIDNEQGQIEKTLGANRKDLRPANSSVIFILPRLLSVY